MTTVVKKVEINQAVCELSSKTLPNPFETTKMYGTFIFVGVQKNPKSLYCINALYDNYLEC